MVETTTARVGTAEELDLIASLPSTFRWGAATAAYQIEGAVAEDGRGPSIWDTFCRVPGAIDGGDTGDVACDHYHRMPQDVALMRELGIDSYRFSVAWPRVQPGGRGPVNPAGIGFYDRLVDELIGSGIEPWVTLYHWDLPQELEDAGGWPERDTAHRFADYAMLVFERLRDRVECWSTLNEPLCSAMLGYYHGKQAPGRREFPAAIAAIHHLLLGHGLATQRMRAVSTPPPSALRAAGAQGPPPSASRQVRLGITLNPSVVAPATDSPLDRDAARRADGLGARIYLDPLRHGRYPADVVDDLEARGVRLPIRDGDLETISTPFDWLGVNYYFSSRVSGVDDLGRSVDDAGIPVARDVRLGRPVTAMDWEIIPDGLTELLVRLGRDYPGMPMVVTESGAAFHDIPDESGFVQDDERAAYLASHIAAVARARQTGADVRGYFVWSLLDNFEWSYGYAKRFGLIRVDYETQRRTLKHSAHWYRDTIRRVRGT
ncbi:MAG TPA: GH1 family beta-glucosidase [Actinophytocola sp.]|uniref:GH1 family beta-glucosidase n=1 Tax=Actinophytocola sp. TaxID=1872138 RepID=UPI002DDDB854|nr:GH1 family beta-glucosidase [Actinophytocola sp.]HEV2782340.1 GH1 family beta-glucosidase [Actinophytocola sp.]